MNDTDTDNINVQNVHPARLICLIRDLNAHDRKQDKFRLCFFILGGLGTILIVLGFVWTFVSYNQSQRISLTGGVAAIMGGFGGVIVNIIKTRRTNRYILEALNELENVDSLKTHIMSVMRLFSEMSMGEGKQYPFQIPMLTILPGMAMFNSLHNFNHADGCPMGNDHFSGLTDSEKSMCVVNLVVALVGLGVNINGIIYYTIRLIRQRGAWVSTKIKAVNDLLNK